MIILQRLNEALQTDDAALDKLLTEQSTSVMAVSTLMKTGVSQIAHEFTLLFQAGFGPDVMADNMYNCWPAKKRDGGPDDPDNEVCRIYEAKVASPIIENAIRKALQLKAKKHMHAILEKSRISKLNTHVGNTYPDVYVHMLLNRQFTEM